MKLTGTCMLMASTTYTATVITRATPTEVVGAGNKKGNFLGHHWLVYAA